MNELALFAGAGGGILGTHSLGINTVCAVERNEHRRCVLMQRQNDRVIPSFPIWDDIRTFDGEIWGGTVDFVSGGFPCQAFSTAARGRNNAVNFWPEMARVIREVLPSYVFAENVSKKAIESAGEECLKMGYKVEAIPFSAKYVGADHVRERYWLLAYADNKGQLCSTINAKVAVVPEFHEGVWETFPDESRMDDGVADRMERYEAIGNGQVPVVAAAALWHLANYGEG